MKITRNSIETGPGPSDWFTGTVYIDAITAPSDGSGIGAASVHFAPGEKRTVVLPLPVSSLAYWDESRHTWVVEREPVRIQVGASSADIRGQADINVVP